MPTAIAVISTRPPAMYDAEYHIGLIPWLYDTTTLLWNTQRLNDALENMWNGGYFEFTHGEPGPVIFPISFSAKNFYFRPPIRTSRRMGGAMYGNGAGAYIIPEYYFTDAPGAYIGGIRTRLVGVNDTGEHKPVVIFSGIGFDFAGFDVYGCLYTGNDVFVGDKAIACIQMEGGNWPVAQGRHNIRQCLLAGATYGIQILEGWYDEDYVLTTDQSHGDMCSVEDTEFFSLDSCIRSDNLIGGFGWDIRRMVVEGIGPADDDTIVFDFPKGGCLNVNTLTINHGRATILRVNEYSPHNNWFDINGIYVDRTVSPDKKIYTTLLKYDGTSYYTHASGLTKPWRIRMSGGIGDYNNSRWDATRILYLNPDSPTLFDTTDTFFDLQNLPLACFDIAGSGPYYKVDANVANARSELQVYSSWHKLEETSGTSAANVVSSGQVGTVGGTTTWTNNASTYDFKFTTRTITNASWATNVATFTSNGHGFEAAQIVTISDVSPSGYNGVYTITAKDTNTFSVALNSDPGAYVSGGKAKHAPDGGGLYFGTTGYLSIPYATENSLYVDSTIAFWIYLNSWTDGVVLSRVDTGANAKNGFRVSAGGNFYLTESGVNHVDFAAAPNTFTTKKWYHIAVSLTGGSNAYKAYLNGVEATPVGGDPGTMTGGQWLAINLPLRAGVPSNAFYGSGSNAADMVLDDIRLYKRVLSDAAVAELYAIGTTY